MKKPGLYLLHTLLILTLLVSGSGVAVYKMQCLSTGEAIYSLGERTNCEGEKTNCNAYTSKCCNFSFVVYQVAPSVLAQEGKLQTIFFSLAAQAEVNRFINSLSPKNIFPFPFYSIDFPLAGKDRLSFIQTYRI